MDTDCGTTTATLKPKNSPIQTGRLYAALQKDGNTKLIFVNGQPIMALTLIHTVSLLELMPKACFYKH